MVFYYFVYIMETSHEVTDQILEQLLMENGSLCRSGCHGVFVRTSLKMFRTHHGHAHMLNVEVDDTEEYENFTLCTTGRTLWIFLIKGEGVS